VLSVDRYEKVKQNLLLNPKAWLITGVAGFIGSNLLETLLTLNQNVIGLDNFSTGHSYNLDEVKSLVSNDQWSRFKFIKGDITNFSDCKNAVREIDFVLHQAALGSVPRSIADPINTNNTNITGFLNMLTAAKEEGVSSFTYAASSSTYGDHPALPKVEENIGNPLSPYAVTKYVNELYASVFAMSYGFKAIGLRYFNVFGQRQDPNGAYAAVIPKWTTAMIKDKEVVINGDGDTSRDFCFIENVVQMNLLAATAPSNAKNEVYNVAVGQRTSLDELYFLIKKSLGQHGVDAIQMPKYEDFRMGDVRHSLADISKSSRSLGYSPQFDIKQGLNKVMPWYIEFLT